MERPSRVEITEVGMRDGFQMERAFIPTETKIAIGRALIAAGVRRLEATSFVSPRAVPQLVDAADVVGALKGEGALLAALVPNVAGAERAAAAGVDEMVVFASASESHNRKNINRSVAESLAGLGALAAIANDAGATLRGAISTSFGCPFEGNIASAAVLRVAEAYAQVGIREISLGDTTGMATPDLVTTLCGELRQRLPKVTIILHFHNTRGLGLVNVWAGLQAGITHYESALGGLGGCPFAAGATGNICSEDLVYMMDEMGIETGISLEAMIGAARKLQTVLGRQLPGQVMKAGPRLSLHPLDAQATAVG